MPDRAKVIKGLEICTSRPCYCTDCPYKKECCLDSQNVMEDALVLLKAQEPQTVATGTNVIGKSIMTCKDICKHAPPGKKWPCVDCDMRVHDMAEPPEKGGEVG